MYGGGINTFSALKVMDYYDLQDNIGMNQKVRASILVISVVIVAMVIVGTLNNWRLSKPHEQPDLPTPKELPDAILIDKANSFVEVKAFRDRYGEPDIAVARVYGLDVEYARTEAEITDKPYAGPEPVEPYVALIVRFDNDVNFESITLWCINQVDPPLKLTHKDNILEYLEKEYCFS